MTTTQSAVGLREIARELGIDGTTVHYWVKQGWVTVLEEPQARGQQKLLDRQSVLDCYAARSKKDRRHRTRTPKRPHPRTTPPPASPHQESLAASGYTSTPTSTDSGFSSPSTGPSSNGSAQSSQTWSTAELLAQHLDERLLRRQPEDTLYNSRYAVGLFAKAIPQLPVARPQLVEYLGTLQGAEATVKSHQAWIGAFLNWAEITAGCPAPNMRRLLREVKLPPPPSMPKEDVQALIAAAENLHDRLMLQTLYFGGLRAGELAGLDRKDIGDDQLNVTGKGRERLVNVPPELCEELRTLGRDHVFCDRFGDRLRADGVTHRVRRYFDKVGLNPGKRGPHVLRHSFGRHMTEQGVNLKVLAEMMGHSTTRMTERYGTPGTEHVRAVYHQYSLINYVNGGSNNGQ